MPCARQTDETLIVTLKDDFSDTEIDLKYSVSDASDVLVRSLAVRNVGSEPVQVKRRSPSARNFLIREGSSPLCA